MILGHFELHDFCPPFVFHAANRCVEIMDLSFVHDFLGGLFLPSSPPGRSSYSSL
jgi:hypothetical protein